MYSIYSENELEDLVNFDEATNDYCQPRPRNLFFVDELEEVESSWGSFGSDTGTSDYALEEESLGSFSLFGPLNIWRRVVIISSDSWWNISGILFVFSVRFSVYCSLSTKVLVDKASYKNAAQNTVKNILSKKDCAGTLDNNLLYENAAKNTVENFLSEKTVSNFWSEKHRMKFRLKTPLKNCFRKKTESKI